MELSKAYQLTRSLMDQHGLTQWKLEWMDRKTTAGLCYNSKLTWDKNPARSRGKIAISTHYFKAFDEADVRETALHEIAHALVPPSEHHGPVWQAMAKKIGSTGKRCVSSEEAAKTSSRYRGTCPQGHVFPRHRKMWDMSIYGAHLCPACKKRKLEASISWADSHTGKVLNPNTKLKKPEPIPGTKILVTTAFEPKKTPIKHPRIVPATAAAQTSFKDRYDRGDTSFADVW